MLAMKEEAPVRRAPRSLTIRARSLRRGRGCKSLYRAGGNVGLQRRNQLHGNCDCDEYVVGHYLKRLVAIDRGVWQCRFSD